MLKADCGGFGFVAYNNVDSVLEAEVGYQVSKNIHIYAGYRSRYASASTTDVAVHGWIHGPMLAPGNLSGRPREGLTFLPGK